MDNKGKVRYFIGSQVDVSGLAKECADLPALKRMLAREGEIPIEDAENHKEEEKDEFQTLCEMFNQHEVETVRKTGGRMHREQVEDDDAASTFHQPRLLLKDASPPLGAHSEVFGKVKNNGKLAGIYSHVSQSESFMCEQNIWTFSNTAFPLVSPCSTIPFTSNPFHFPISTRARHPPIRVHGSDRRQLTGARRT